MKKLILALAAVAFIAFGCKKSSNSSSTGAGMSAKVNGQGFAASSTYGLFSVSEGELSVFGISASGIDSTGIEVDIWDTLKVGEPGPFSGGEGVAYATNQGVDFYGDEVDGHGLVTLSAWDTTQHTIAGTFSGVLVDNNGDSLTVTSGTFNTTYTEIP
jgi:hypothetical protein